MSTPLKETERIIVGQCTISQIANDNKNNCLEYLCFLKDHATTHGTTRAVAFLLDLHCMNDNNMTMYQNNNALYSVRRQFPPIVKIFTKNRYSSPPPPTPTFISLGKWNESYIYVYIYMFYI